jgi:hypothetical protein
MQFVSGVMNGAVSYCALHPRLWQASVLGTCTGCAFLAARLLGRTHKRNILYVCLPVTVFALLSVVHALSLVSNSFFNFAMAGTVTGIILSITPAVFQKRRLVVTVRRDERDELTSEIVFEDWDGVTTRGLHARIAEALQVAPGHVHLESGRGAFVEDLDSLPVRSVLRPLPCSAEVQRAVCYVRVDDPSEDIVPLGLGKRVGRATSIVSLLANKLPPILHLKAEVRLGALVQMLGKMPNAANAGSAFSLSCVQTYAAATTSSSAKHLGIKFHPWQTRAAGAGAGAGAGSPDANDDATSAGGQSNASDDGPVRCGNTVVIECEGK